MRQLQKVLWTKGILLGPQHLQAQDRYLEDLISSRLGSASIAPWGFSRLEIDHASLEGGNFALTAGEGLLPDGLPFSFPGADIAPPPRPVAEHWSQDQTSLDLYLAIPEHRHGGRNVSFDAVTRGTRYVAELAMRRDENTGLAEKPLQVARRNLRLILEGEALDGHSVLPVARLNRKGPDGFHVDPNFVPPLLDILASERLMAIARRLVEILAAKSTDLGGTRRQRNRSLADFGSSDVANFWLLYTVNSHLPLLRHIHDVKRGHPDGLYKAMLALGGALTSFSTSYHPRDLPAYDHGDLGTCFLRLDEIVRDLLETVVPANHITLPLRQTKPLMHATALDEDRLLNAPQMFLAVQAQMPRDELARRVPQLLKISSADQIERLIRQALPGVELRYSPKPPSALPVKLDHEYFSLERSGTDWNAIRMARNLAVYVPSDLPEARLELVALLAEQG